MLGCKPFDTRMDPYQKFKEDGERLIDAGRYKRLVGHLIYQSKTHPYIDFVAMLQANLCMLLPRFIWRLCTGYFAILKKAHINDWYSQGGMNYELRHI